MLSIRFFSFHQDRPHWRKRLLKNFMSAKMRYYKVWNAVGRGWWVGSGGPVQVLSEGLYLEEKVMDSWRGEKVGNQVFFFFWGLCLHSWNCNKIKMPEMFRSRNPLLPWLTGSSQNASLDSNTAPWQPTRRTLFEDLPGRWGRELHLWWCRGQTVCVLSIVRLLSSK